MTASTSTRLTAAVAAVAMAAGLAACAPERDHDQIAETGTTLPTDPLVQPGQENMVGTQPQVGQQTVGAAFTDEQIQAYAQALSRVNEGRVGPAGETLTEVVQAPRAAVEEAGLSVEDFIRIAAASAEDPTLRQRIQTQVMQHGQPVQGGAAGAGAQPLGNAQ